MRLKNNGSERASNTSPTLATTVLLVKGPAMVLLSLPIVPVPVEYREVPGYPGYRLGADGSIWSRWHQKGRRGKAFMSDAWHRLMGSVGWHGYLKIRLCANGRRRYVRIHTLILEVFVGPRPKGMEACHNNGDCCDNRLENLRWDTHKANAADMGQHGTSPRGERQPRAKLTEAIVREMRRLNVIEGLGSRRLSKIFPVSRTCIERVIYHRTWKHITD